MSSEVVFYHGTRAPFGPRGGLLLPGAETGQDNTTNSDDYRPGVTPYAATHVYVTTDRELAEEFARRARGRGRPRVLIVQPWAPLIPDDATYNGEDRDDVFRCPAANVLRREWV